MPLYTDAYNVALAALAARLGVDVDSEVVNQRLRDLQGPVKLLRQQYDNGQKITIKYTGDLADAYSMAYFPPYATALHRILCHCGLPESATSWGSSTIRICILAAGPAPEVFAVDRAFRGARVGSAHLDFVLIDNQPDGWRATRDSLVEATRATSTNHISTTVSRGDLTDERFLDAELPRLLNDCHLVIMQNCLNELAEDADTFSSRFARAIETLPPGAAVVISDLSGYGGNRKRLNDLAERLENLTGTHGSLTSALAKPRIGERPDVPKPIAEHLLTWDEFLRPRLNVNASFIAYQKDFAGLVRWEPKAQAAEICIYCGEYEGTVEVEVDLFYPDGTYKLSIEMICDRCYPAAEGVALMFYD